jgi:hypothetical protein
VIFCGVVLRLQISKANLDSSNIGVDGHLASNVAMTGFDVQFVFLSNRATIVSNSNNF